MSLTVNGQSAAKYDPISEGTHLAVCNMLVDLGMQKSEVYGNSSKKIRIGWEITDETIELDDGPKPRTISKNYTATLDERGNLRKDLAAWRGRDFTPEELAGFDLKNIVGKSCLINIVHGKGQNGNVYANVGNVMALPKGMTPAKLSEPAVVFDLDNDPLEKIDTLPKFLQEMIRKSSTYEERLNAPVQLKEIQDDGELPF